MKKHFGCPVQATSNVLAGKWKVLIVWHLSFGQRRFAEIRDLLPGVSEKVLTAQLRELERDGVIRRVAAEVVPRRAPSRWSRVGRSQAEYRFAHAPSLRVAASSSTPPAGRPSK
jgi:DNA-binding HxlR family transcriptional regulator